MILAHATPGHRLGSLVHDGVSYDPDADGHVEVPEEVGRVLVRFPHLSAYTGPPEPTPEEAEAAEKAELRARVEELEKALAESNSRRARKPVSSETRRTSE